MQNIVIFTHLCHYPQHCQSHQSPATLLSSSLSSSSISSASSSSSAHVALERNDAERPENEGEEDGNSGDESVECDSESDEDDDVVAFVDESDNETEVPVNTPGGTRTRDWQAIFT